MKRILHFDMHLQPSKLVSLMVLIGHHVGQFVRSRLIEAPMVCERGLAQVKKSLDNLSFPLMGRLKLYCFEGKKKKKSPSSRVCKMTLCQSNCSVLGFFVRKPPIKNAKMLLRPVHLDRLGSAPR